MGFTRFRLLMIAFISEGVAFIAALLLARFFEINFLPLSHNIFRDIVIGSAGAAAPFALFIFIVSERATKIPLLDSLRRKVVIDVRAVFSNARIFDLVVISLLAGFAEEFLFRGVLQARFGIIAASIIFGLVHFISPAYVIVTVLMGFYIGIFYHLSGSLLVPVQLHFMYDLAALVYLRYFFASEADTVSSNYT